MHLPRIGAALAVALALSGPAALAQTAPPPAAPPQQLMDNVAELPLQGDPAPTVPPTTTSPPIVLLKSKHAAVIAIIRATWPDELEEQAIRVARCESVFLPTARNGQYSGLYQIGRREWQLYGHGSVFNPWENSAAAYRYWRVSHSWRAWQCKP